MRVSHGEMKVNYEVPPLLIVSGRISLNFCAGGENGVEREVLPPISEGGGMSFHFRAGSGNGGGSVTRRKRE